MAASTTGVAGSDQIIGELGLLAEKDVKQMESSDLAVDDSLKGEVLETGNEPITTRRELWSWYAYYFGNNSAGPLSYAPLSMSSFLMR